MANAFESNTRAQGSLEALPDLVLRYTKIFHTYIRLFVDDGTKVLELQNGNIPAVNSGMDEVSRTLRNLLDEIAVLGGWLVGKFIPGRSLARTRKRKSRKIQMPDM
jgi:hypothetical protein